MNDHYDKKMVTEEKIKEDIGAYYRSVVKDFEGLKRVYPFCYLTILPTVEPREASISIVAADKELIDITEATEDDFLGEYSRELWIRIPIRYKEDGCDVFGGKWIKKENIPQSQQHFYNRDPDKGYRFCVGVPDSFKTMSNVILENVKTADHILTAYADYISGRTKNIVLAQYSHGDRGINEYRRKKH